MIETATPPTRAGRPKSQAKREAIRAAGVHLFLARGLDAVSMDEVAQAAEVSKQTVYSHFGSKEELFQACIRAKLASHSLSSSDIPEGLAPLDALEEMARRFLELMADPEVICMHRAVIAQGTQHPTVARLFFDAGPQQAVAAMRHLLGEADERGELVIADLDEAAELFVSMLKGLSDLRCILDVSVPFPPEARAGRAARMVGHLRAMYQPPVA